jgi:uncharacterized protein Yka (UPF0111/DUF47 family)
MKKKLRTLEELEQERYLQDQKVHNNFNHSLRRHSKEILFYIQCAEDAQKELQKRGLSEEEVRLLTEEVEGYYDTADAIAADTDRNTHNSYTNYPMYKTALEKLSEVIKKMGYLPDEHITRHLD